MESSGQRLCVLEKMSDVHANALHLPILFDLLGVFTAAASGALAAVRKGLDLVGVLVLGAVTGLGGGVVRDLMIGAIPPAVLADWRYLTIATAASLAVIAAQYPLFGHRRQPALDRLRARIPLASAFNLADAATLGCFAVSGTGKALQYGLAAMPAALMGVVTAVGGGVIRDVLVNEVPTVLRRELYAVPALIGALIVVVAARLEPALTPLAFLAAAVTAAARLVSLRRGWHLQLPREKERARPEKH
jgi:uncharacterized membrane protein YeiH